MSKLITFTTQDAVAAFHTMCEGMWENRRDDMVSPDGGDASEDCAKLEKLITQTSVADGAVYPVTTFFNDDLAEAAFAAVENLEDDGDPEYVPGSVTISDNNPAAAEMNEAQALDVAIELLAQVSAETDTASPEGHSVRLAHDCLQATRAKLGDGDEPTTYRVINLMDALRASIKLNVFDYFTTNLGRAPSDVTLRELPVNSGCGDDCVKAINAARDLLTMLKMAGTDPTAVIAATDDAVQTFWRG